MDNNIEKITIGKLLEVGGLVCLAAYIKAETGLSDIACEELAYNICDAVDEIIHNHINDDDETEE